MKFAGDIIHYQRIHRIGHGDRYHILAAVAIKADQVMMLRVRSRHGLDERLRNGGGVDFVHIFQPQCRGQQPKHRLLRKLRRRQQNLVHPARIFRMLGKVLFQRLCLNNPGPSGRLYQ